MYDVRLSAPAEKVYRKAEKPLAKKLARCFETLETDPRGSVNARALAGNLAGLYRYRVGDYRVLYEIDDQKQIVSVLRISHRSEAYK